MDFSFTHHSAATREQIFSELSDLGRYSAWMPVVRKAVLVSGQDVAPIWDVTLTGAVGRLRRSKRIRMQRTEQLPNRLIVFERSELGDKTHSAWRLTVQISDDQCETADSELDLTTNLASVTVHLHYGGGLFEPLVGRMLNREIERSKQQLEACLLGQS